MERTSLKVGDEIIDRGDTDITGIVRAKINDIIAIQWNDGLIDWVDENHILIDFKLKENKSEVKRNNQFNLGDKVLAKLDDGYKWEFGEFRKYSEDKDYPYHVSTFMHDCKYCIPYNKDTFELLGTKKII